jgi:hypothetical protein
MNDKEGDGDIRTIYKTREYDSFFDSLSKKVQEKFEFTYNVIQTIKNIPVKYIKYLEGTGLYEMRVSVGTNEYRTILFTMDSNNVINATKIVLLNGFLKNSTKDYKKQVAIAQKILKGLER